jgi:hypothetical protein
VIVFGTAVTHPETYDRCVTPGLRRAAELDSIVLAHQSAGSLFRNYNLLLDEAAAYEDLEALVLLHQDVEIADADFPLKLREALRDPEVAIVGCAGAIGVRSIAWWQGALTWAGLTHRYPEYGGGEFPAISWHPWTVPSYARTGPVDSIDGFVFAMSPWAVRELRFDESLGKLHGYDFDICMQARAAGKKVVTADFRAIHHRSLELINDPEAWIQTFVRLSEKWEDQLPDTGAEPKQRALRAEAEAACARAIMVAHQMRETAIERQLGRVQRELEATRAELDAAVKELAAARAAAPPSDEAPDARGEASAAAESPPGPGGGRLAVIDYAVEELGIQSFASVEIGRAAGQYAFYAIERPGVRQGALLDAGARSPGDHLLNAIELASEREGMRVVDGGFADAATVAELGHVDAVLLFDVLVRLVAPDWDEVLDLYAPATSAFVIVNPQWEGGERTVRLIELGRERFLAAVPPWPGTRELFDQLDAWDPAQQRRYRDGSHLFQWGITDADLKAKLEGLGFELVRDWAFNPFPEAEGFVTKGFVFRRR